MLGNLPEIAQDWIQHELALKLLVTTLRMIEHGAEEQLFEVALLKTRTTTMTIASSRQTDKISEAFSTHGGIVGAGRDPGSQIASGIVE